MKHWYLNGSSLSGVGGLSTAGVPTSTCVGRLSLSPRRFRIEVVARIPHRTRHSRRNDITVATARR